MPLESDGAFKDIQRFLDEWRIPIRDRIGSDEQRLALFALWSRYWTSLHALHVLRDHLLLTDCYSVARTCLECDVAIQAIVARPSLGTDYLDHRGKSLGKHLKKLDEQGLAGNQTLPAQEWFIQNFGTSWRSAPNSGWHWYSSGTKRGVDALLRDFAPEDQHLYFGFSNAAHGFYQGVILFEAQYAERVRFAAQITDIFTMRFLMRTGEAAKVFWGPLRTFDSAKFWKEYAKLTLRRGLPKGPG